MVVARRSPSITFRCCAAARTKGRWRIEKSVSAFGGKSGHNKIILQLEGGDVDGVALVDTGGVVDVGGRGASGYSGVGKAH